MPLVPMEAQRNAERLLDRITFSVDRCDEVRDLRVVVRGVEFASVRRLVAVQVRIKCGFNGSGRPGFF